MDKKDLKCGVLFPSEEEHSLFSVKSRQCCVNSLACARYEGLISMAVKRPGVNCLPPSDKEI